MTGRIKLLPRSQGGCTLAAEVVFAARADGTSQPQCPVAVTDCGNGTHELAFISTVVCSCYMPAYSDAVAALVAVQSHRWHIAMHLTLMNNNVSGLFCSHAAIH